MKRRTRVVLLTVAGLLLIGLAVGGFFGWRIVSMIARSTAIHDIAYACLAYREDHGLYPTPAEGNPAWTALGKLVPEYLPSAEGWFLTRFQPSRPADRRALARFEGPGSLPRDVRISYWYMPLTDSDALMLAEIPGRVRTRGKLLAADASRALVAMTESELRAAIGPSLPEDQPGTASEVHREWETN